MSTLDADVILERARIAKKLANPCRLCPHECLVNRLGGETGRCRIGPHVILAAATAHFGEEPEISGKRGSGTLFFGSCNLRCIYCQNFQISQDFRTRRKEPTPAELVACAALRLQDMGCHNINWVTPSHVVPWACEAHGLAVAQGLKLPLVYNTSGYDSVEVLKLLEGIVDIYLTDLRYSDDETAWRFSKAKNYVKASRAAVLEMARQVGSEVEYRDDGIARRGLIVRLLVLPNDLAGLGDTLSFLRDNLGTRVRISLMAQYYPTNKANREILLSRPIFYGEYYRAISLVEKMGFENVIFQDMAASDFYRPDFDRGEEPFKDSPREKGERETCACKHAEQL